MRPGGMIEKAVAATAGHTTDNACANTSAGVRSFRQRRGTAFILAASWVSAACSARTPDRAYFDHPSLLAAA